MRRGTHPKFIHIATDGLILTPERDNHIQSAVLDLDPTTRLLGVNCSADYTAEHEWGIKPLYEAFGVKHEIDVYGLKKRKVTKIPKTLAWIELSDGRQGFAFRDFWHNDNPINSLTDDRELRTWDKFDTTQRKMVPGDIRLVCAWSECSFACLSDDKDDIAMLRELFAAFRKKDIVLTFGKSLPAFDNPGLIIAIASRLSKEVIKMWADADKEAHEIEKYVAKSKIRELLKKKIKGYFALSARRWEDGSIKFWLNPYDQHKVNYGWFTLEHLRQWADDKGPIPMTPTQIIEKHEERYGRKQTKVLQ